MLTSTHSPNFVQAELDYRQERVRADFHRHSGSGRRRWLDALRNRRHAGTQTPPRVVGAPHHTVSSAH